MAHTSEREKQIMRQTLRLLTSELRPRRVILFGSRAKGHATRSSDFDFAVDAERPAPPRWRRLARKIDAVAGLYRIDLVFLPQISKTFRNVILQTGRVIYER